MNDDARKKRGTAAAPAQPADGPAGREPRWPAFAAALAAAGLFAALPGKLGFAPRGFTQGAVAVLVLLSILSYRHSNFGLARLVSFANLGLLTALLLGALGILVRALLVNAEGPQDMLRSAASLWITNVLVFALWYWRLDAGGPHARDRRRRARQEHTKGAFLFPQMTLSAPQREELGARDWSPQFWDYLFVAFAASASFAPADTAVLSRWAKLLMMLQASISLTVIALLAGRAVNIL